MSWLTYNELDFIERMGSHKDDPAPKELSKERRTSLLKSYLAAMEVRFDWGRMDRQEVKQAVEKAIAET